MINEINELKKSRNAVILAHLYQPAQIQEIADFTGDSLELSRKAASTDAQVIVFCGVHFMAETASILSPSKTVLLPDLTAGCPMADMVVTTALKDLKNQHPKAKVITYVNSSAEVKAESDVCCTSSNAVAIVKAMKDYELIFTPDKNLGAWAAKEAKKEMILWNGYCCLHNGITTDMVNAAKAAHSGAEVLVHPECLPEVSALADKVMSTSAMCNYAKRAAGKEFIIGTEPGIMYRLTKENPDKKFYLVDENAVCRQMKKITLPKILSALTNMDCEVKVPEPLRSRALGAISEMVKHG